MDTISLRSGNRMPVIGCGTWKMTDHTADTVVAALEEGYRLIDTSGDYGTQPAIGEGIRRSAVAREDIFLVTKVEETDDAYNATRHNLAELGFDYADLVLIHRPPEEGEGEKLWRGLMRAKEEGLARDIGVSNYSPALIDRLVDATDEAPVVNQIEWSPFGHSDAVQAHHTSRGIVIQAYSPLTRMTRLDDATVREIAHRHDMSPVQVLLRWNLQRGTVPLPKANQREHLRENIAVLDFALSDDDMAMLNRLNEGYSALGSLPYL